MAYVSRSDRRVAGDVVSVKEMTPAPQTVLDPGPPPPPPDRAHRALAIAATDYAKAVKSLKDAGRVVEQSRHQLIAAETAHREATQQLQQVEQRLRQAAAYAGSANGDGP